MAIDVKLTLQDQATRVYNQFIGNVNSKAATLDNTMKSLGTTIGAAFSIGAIVSFAKAAADAEAGTVALRNALKNTGDTSEDSTQAFLDQADALKKKTAVDDDEIKRVQALTIAMTGNASAAMQLTPAILDLAQGMGISTEQAAKMFSKSVEGSEGLKKAGIVIGETATEAERLARISQAVEEKWGGAAAAFANTDAGKIKQVSLAVEDLEKGVGKVFLGILGPSLPGIVKLIDGLAWAFEKTVLAIKVVTATIMTGLIAPFAAVENKLNELGISSSKTFQNFMISGMNQTKDAALELTGGIETTNKSTGTIGSTAETTSKSMTLMKDNIKALQDELAKLNPGTKDYEAVLRKVNAAQFEYDSAVRSSNVVIHLNESSLMNLGSTITTNVIPKVKSLKEEMQGLKLTLIAVDLKAIDISSSFNKYAKEFANSYGLTLQTVSGQFAATMDILLFETEDTTQKMKDMWNSFFRYLVDDIIKNSAAEIAKFASSGGKEGSSKVGSLLGTIGGSIVGGPLGGTIGGFLGGMLGFDGGGGAFVDAPQGTAVPVMVHGQEKLRVTTPEQEREYQQSRGGTTVIINYNHPVEGKEFIRSGLSKIARELGVNSVGDITVNQRSQIAFS